MASSSVRSPGLLGVVSHPLRQIVSRFDSIRAAAASSKVPVSAIPSSKTAQRIEKPTKSVKRHECLPFHCGETPCWRCAATRLFLYRNDDTGVVENLAEPFCAREFTTGFLDRVPEPNCEKPKFPYCADDAKGAATFFIAWSARRRDT
jgi:hypothetical protein